MKKNYLISGHILNQRIKNINRDIINQLSNKRVSILNFPSNTEKKEKIKEKYLKNYFQELGAEKVDLITSEESTERVKEIISGSELIYLPEGDSKIFFDNINKHNLQTIIEQFQGIIAGNNSGAYVQCQEYIRGTANFGSLCKMMGLVEFNIKTNYTKQYDPLLMLFSTQKPIYALENESAIEINNKEMNFIGKVWKFYQRNKKLME